MTPFAAIAGPLAPLLMDPMIGEVVVNGPADVWVEIDGRLRPVETRFRDSTDVRRTAVRLAPGSRLASLVAAPPTVACHHHQSVRSHPGLTAVGWAPDGLLEAIEDDAHPFRLAVQWHPEVDADRGLFAGLVAAARVWSAGGRGASGASRSGGRGASGASRPGGRGASGASLETR